MSGWKGSIGVRLRVAAGLIALGVASPATPGGAPPAGAATGAEPATYTNPVSTADMPAPYIVRDTSTTPATYYAFAGKGRIPVRRSTTLTSWSAVSSGVLTRGPWAATTQGTVTPNPAVWKAGSTWVLYYTAKDNATKRPCIGIATATSVVGPYTDTRTSPLVCTVSGNAYKGASDPSLLLLTSDTGSTVAQLLWAGHDPMSGSPTQIWSRLLRADGLGFESGVGASRLLAAQEGGWEDATIAHPTVTWDIWSQKMILMYSGAAPKTPGHAVGWASCRQYLGILVDCSREALGSWMSSTSQLKAPAGAEIFSDGAHSWLVYSGYAPSQCTATACTGNRTLRLDKLCVATGTPRTNGPSVTSQQWSRWTDCSQDIGTRSLAPGTPPASTTLGALAQSSSVIGRDDGVSAAVGDRSLWAFGDTFGCQVPVKNSACSNTGATVDPPSPSLHTATEFPTPGVPQLLIPYTEDELADPLFAGNTRIVHWPESVLHRSDGTALLFYGRLYTNGGAFGDSLGSGVACVSLNGACPVSGGGTANVSRLGEVFPPGEAAFAGGAVERGSYVYLYGGPSACSESCVARVHSGLETYRSAYSFWNGSDWVGDAAAAVPMTGAGAASPSATVSFNAFLGQYLRVYQPLWDVFGAEQHFALQTAALPEGPWSEPVIVGGLLPPVPGHIFPNYAMMEHPELAADGGRTILVSYSHVEGDYRSSHQLVRITLGQP